MKKCFSTIWMFLLIASLLLSACAPSVEPTAPSEPSGEVSEPGEEVSEPGEESSEPVEESKILKIGVVGPYTGPVARLGNEIRDCVTEAFEAIDYKIGDYVIELVWIDSESDPEKATRAYEEAITRQGIDVGLMNWHSSVAVALMEVAAKYEMPHFFAQGATDVIVEKYLSDPDKYSYWLGKVWPVTSKLTIAYVLTIEDAIEKGIWDPGEKTAALLAEDTDWGRSWAGGIRPQFEEVGWEFVSEDYMPSGETDFYPLLSKLKDSGVGLVLLTHSTPPSIAAFVKQSRELNLPSLVVADGLGYVGEWYELTGDASDYLLDSQPQWSTDEQKAWVDSFEERWGIRPSASSGGLAFDATNLFIKIAQGAFEKYGNLDRETLYTYAWEEIEAGEFSYTDGIVMSEYLYTTETFPDPVVGEGYFIPPVTQYFGGEALAIWPDYAKVQDLQLPPWMTSE
jgi:branched-chain amino acid transport system substrate-binding protein